MSTYEGRDKMFRNHSLKYEYVVPNREPKISHKPPKIVRHKEWS